MGEVREKGWPPLLGAGDCYLRAIESDFLGRKSAQATSLDPLIPLESEELLHPVAIGRVRTQIVCHEGRAVGIGFDPFDRNNVR